jgi:signal recognition particle GTPase
MTEEVCDIIDMALEKENESYDTFNDLNTALKEADLGNDNLERVLQEFSDSMRDQDAVHRESLRELKMLLC